MKYIDKYLLSDEKIIYRAHLHWIIFLWPIIWFLLALIFFGIGGRVSIVFGIIFIAISIVHGLISFVVYKTSEFGITNKRVLVKVGFIRRNSLEIFLTKLEGIQVQQGIIGRILDFGSIIISGTGGLRESFHKIAAPLELRKNAQEWFAFVEESKKNK